MLAFALIRVGFMWSNFNEWKCEEPVLASPVGAVGKKQLKKMVFDGGERLWAVGWAEVIRELREFSRRRNQGMIPGEELFVSSFVKSRNTSGPA